MRLLLDECVPHKLRRSFPEHQVRTVTELGWDGTKNGKLLRRAAESGFDVLLTVDANLPYQQNTSELPVAVVVIRTFSNDINVLREFVPEVQRVLERLEPGQLYWVGGR